MFKSPTNMSLREIGGILETASSPARIRLETLFSIRQPVELTHNVKKRSDNLIQAALWTNNKTLWHLVKSIGSVQPRPPANEQSINTRKTQSKDSADIVRTSITSLVYEIEHQSEADGERQDLLDAYKDLKTKLGDSYREHLDQAAEDTVVQQYEFLCEGGEAYGMQDDIKNTICNMIMLVMDLVDIDIRRKHEAERQAEQARHVHPLLKLFKLHMYLRARTRLRHRTRNRNRNRKHGGMAEEPETDRELIRNYIGPLGEQL
mmetsp:Transcript_21660/g.47582  ORF Transcript_21660/g.47582 Transcript_21660/m.47582 type:complete len:262 (-) Transcript_21660:218-1003(-)